MYGTNFLSDTKFNNYKQHRLFDNNSNCKFLCDRFFDDFSVSFDDFSWLTFGQSGSAKHFE